MTGRLRAILLFSAVLSGLSLGSMADESVAEEVRAPIELRFAFGQADFETVLDVVSRAAGMPMVIATEVPKGTITFKSPETYDLANGLRVLNTILQTKGVTVRVDGDVLRLESLKDMHRANLPTFMNTVPDDITDDQLITVMRPLRSAMAEAMTVQLKPMVGEYGQLIALPGQNAIVLTEMAGKVRRLLRIIEEADQQSPEGQVEVYPLKHVPAQSLIKPLNDLMSVKVEKWVPGKKGKLQKVEEVSLQGVSFSADARSNAIIAKGAQPALDRLREIIALLDTASDGGDRELRVLPLSLLDVDTAIQRLSSVIATMPKGERPVLVPMPEQLSIGVSGSKARVEEVAQLVAALEGPSAPLGDQIIVNLPLKDARADAVLLALDKILPQSRKIRIRMVAGPDGRSLVLAGSTDEIAAVKAIVPALDAKSTELADVRVLHLRPEGINEAIAQARRLASDELDGVQVDVSPDGIAVITGPRSGVTRMGTLLTQLDAARPDTLETRRLPLMAARASEVAATLRTSLRVLLDDVHKPGFIMPTLQPVDALQMLVVQADPEQFEEIERAVRLLDVSSKIAEFEPMRSDPAALVNTVQHLVNAGALGGPVADLELFPDMRTRTVLVSGRAADVDAVMALLKQRDDATPLPVDMQMLAHDIKHSDPSAIAPVLTAMLRDEARWPHALRQARAAGTPVPVPSVIADASAGRLMIDAPLDLMPLASTLLAELDRPASDTGTVEVRVIQLERADAGTVTMAVEAAMAAKGKFSPAARQVVVQAEPSSNAIVMTGPVGALAEAEKLIASLDEGVSAEASQVRTVYLEHARADRVAPVVEQLMGSETYTLQERIEAARRRVALPEVRDAVKVAADSRLNAVVIVARPGVLPIAEALVKQLDVADQAARINRSLQVIPVRHADATELARTLQPLLSEDLSLTPALVQVDRASNTLLVRGDEAQLARLVQVVSEIDRAALVAGRRLEVVPIDASNVDAAELAATLKRLLDQHEGSSVEIVDLEDLLKEPPATPAKSSAVPMGIKPWLVAAALGAEEPSEPTVSIAVDPNTNSLVLLGGDRAVRRARALLDQLLRQAHRAPGRLRRIDLHGAHDPSRLSSLLTQTLRTMTPAGGNRGDVAKRVAVVPDLAGEAIFITCSDADFKTVTEVLRAIAPSSNSKAVRVVKVIPLQESQANVAAIQVREMLRAQAGQAGRIQRMVVEVLGGSPVQADFRPEQVVISGDARTGALIVSGPPESIPVIEQLVALIDAAPIAGQPALRIFDVTHAAAADLRGTILQLMRARYNARRTKGIPVAMPEVVADERTNSLIVTAAEPQLLEVASLLSQLDVSTSKDMPPLETVDIVSSQPSVIARLVKQSLLASNPAAAANVTVVPDDASGLLLIRAEDSMRTRIKSLVAQLDRDRSEQFDIRTIQLERADAGMIAQAIQRLFDDRARISKSTRSVTVIGDPGSSTLLVAADDDDFAAVQDLSNRLDSPSNQEQFQIRAFPLKHAKAAEVSNTVKDMVMQLSFGTQIFGGWFGRNRSGGGDMPGRLAVFPDTRLNALVVTGHGESFDIVEQVIAVVDAASPEGSERSVRTYHVAGTSLQTVEDMVRDLYGSSRRQGWWDDGDETAPVVRLDEKHRVLIVAGNATQHAEIQDLLDVLDTWAVGDRSIVKTFPLEEARASDVVRVLRESLGLRNDGSTSGTVITLEDGADPVEVRARIVADTRSNSLIVTANEQSIPIIAALIEDLDSEPTVAEVEYHLVPLEHAIADDVRWSLQQMVMSMPYPRPEIDSDRTSNQLIIAATPSQFEQLSSLIEQLDTPRSSTRETRFLALEHAEADKIRQALSVFYGPYAMEADTPSKLNVSIVADPSTNSLVVSAEEEEWAGIEALIAELDNEAYDSSLQVRVLPLTHAQAESVARAINEAFSREVTRRGAKSATRKQGNDDRDADVPTMLVQSEEWVSASAEPVTNSVIVAATGRTLERIEAIVETLDQPNTSVDVKVVVITLEASPVARVASTLAKTYTSRAEQLHVPLSIEHDAMTNSLVVATSGALADEIRATAEQLDGMIPAAGHGVTVIELQHIAPSEAIRVIEGLGLDQQPRDDSMSRLVNEPIRVTKLEGRNAVMVLSNPADTDTVVDILRAVDERPPGAEATMQIIELHNASAEDMARVLTEMFDPADQQVGTPLAKAVQEQVRRLALRHDEVGRGLVTLDLTEPIRIVPHEVQNALIVTSTTSNVLAVAAIVELLDLVPVSGAAVIRVIPLENIAAVDFQRIVQDVFAQSKSLSTLPGTDIQGRPSGIVGAALLDDVAMSVDERTNTVVVAGREDAVATVEVLVERLDSDMATGWLEVRVIPLQFADPSDMADTLHKVLVEGSTDMPNAGPMQAQVGRLRVAAGGGAAIDAQIFQPMHRLAMVPEPALEALIVVGSAINIQVVAELISMLDVEGASPASTVRVYPVQHATAGQLASMLDRLIDGQLQSGSLDDDDATTIQADVRTNSIIVSSSPKVFSIVESLLDTLDSNEAPDFQEIRTLKLQTASATRLASLVQRMMDARVERLRAVEPEAAAMERTVVIADEVSNTLLVAASAGGFTVIEQMLERLDDAAYINSALVEVIDAGTSNAPRLADTIRTVMERRYADLPADMRRRQMPLVQVDTRTDSLLVSASPEDLTSIKDLVAKLDAVPMSPAIGLHVLPVGGSGNAERLAPRIEQLMRERARSLGEAEHPTDRVSIEFETSINSLIVSASDENFVVIEELLRMLVDAEQTGDDGRVVDVIPLSIGQASEVARLLDDLYVREANRTRGPGTVRVSADTGLNSILVNAPQRDAEEIRDLIERLEGTSPADILEIRHIPLSSANAIETVSLIEDVLAGRSIGRGRSRQMRSTVLRYVRAAAEDGEAAEMAITTALRETINLTPDIRTNTVIVRAPRDSMQLLVDMISDLDASSTGSKSLRVFVLENADALAMRVILRDLFRLDEGQDLLVLKPRDNQVPVPGLNPAAVGALVEPGLAAPGFDGGGLGGTELTAVPDPRQQLAITVDTRTNSLLVSGSPAYLDLVQEVVDALDTLEANERETLVYQLRNATAEEVARVLGEFVEEEQRTLIETLGVGQLGSAARMLEREVTIRGDAKSNSLLVSASPRYMGRVEDMIAALDVDPPQVLIQVLLAEVSLEGGVDWGIDFRARIGGAASDSGFGLPIGGIAPVAALLGVPSLAIGSSDFQLVLEALESQGRLHILSNPSVMAANNEEATINVGELIYVAQGAQTFDTGVVSVPLEEKDVGVSLVVTPSINPDGYVRLDVQPTLSKLLAERDEPAVGVTSPRILQRTADTTITVHDGQTVVIGGLINESYEHFTEKVPILGDIPLLGLLFRSEKTSLVRNELVIVITPHIIRSPADLDRVKAITSDEIGRMNLPGKLLEQIGRGRLERESLFIREDGVLKVKDLSVEESDEDVSP